MTNQQQSGTEIAQRQTGTVARVEAGHVISDPQQLVVKINEWRALGYHVIGPAIRVMAFAPNFGVNAAIDTIDTTMDEKGIGPEVYRSDLFHKGHEVSLGKVGLRKIGRAAGVDWITAECGRTSDPAIANYWEYRAVGAYRAYDGMIQRLPGTAEVDLRDGSPQLRGWTEKQTLQARRFGLRLAESKAMNAAIRELGLRSKYTVDELKRPFVALRVTYIPDMSDPETKRMVTAHALGGLSALYPGRQPAAALPEAAEPFVPLERPVQPRAVQPAAPASTAPADALDDIPDLTPAQPAPVPKPAKLAYRILDAAKFSEGTQTVYGFRTDHTGDEWVKTADVVIARAAADAKKTGALLDLSLERKQTGLYILELQPAQGELKL